MKRLKTCGEASIAARRESGRHRLLLSLFLLIAAVVITGCSGAARPTTWTTLAIGNGIIYAADLEQVRALDAETGQELWAFPTEPDLRRYGPFYTVSLLDHEVLFATSYERTGGGLIARSQGVLRALSIEDGQELWSFTGAGGEFVAPGAVSEEILVIGNSDGNVYAFFVEDGSPAWDTPFPTEGRVWATPLVLSDTVYVASLDHRLYALDLGTGRERWRFEAGGALAGPPLAVGDRLYVGAFDHTLYALQKEDGTLVWKFEGRNWFWGSPATDGTSVYAADVDGNVYALEIETGREIWRSEVDQTVHLGPVMGEDKETLLIAGDRGTLYGLDPTDGFVLWSQPGDGQVSSVVADGKVAYISRIYANEHVQAVYIDNGRALWAYPPAEAEQ